MQDLTSVISTAMVLVLLGLVMQTAYTAKIIGDSVRTNLTLTIEMKDGTPGEEAKQLMGQLKKKAYVGEITYISSEQALAEQKESMGIDPAEFIGTNPFPISMEVGLSPTYASTDSLEWITRELQDMPNVNEVVYMKELVEKVNHTLRQVTVILLVIAALLILISISLIRNTVRLNIFSQRFLIHTMKLVGAKWSLIRRPFMIKGLYIGIISSLLANLCLLGMAEGAKFYDSSLGVYLNWEVMGGTALCILGFGLCITLVSTFRSVTRFLKMRENELF